MAQRERARARERERACTTHASLLAAAIIDDDRWRGDDSDDGLNRNTTHGVCDIRASDIDRRAIALARLLW
jgi:hypothetical protein